jgi:predicted aspartyl protease
MGQYTYDQNYWPPFPTIEIVIANPFSDQATDPMPAKVDTGADMTVIPRRLAAELGLTPFSRVLVQGFRGQPEMTRTYPADVNVNGYTIEFAELILNEAENELLLGRDVLNELVLVLNGPASIVEVVRSRSERSNARGS